MAQFLLTQSDEWYPSLLRSTHPPPETLYGEGNATVLSRNAVSIVGSRSMSSYGATVLRRLIPGLVRAGLVIVSGLAYGVDAESHRIALAEGGQCVAVLGSALDRLYPAQHAKLYHEITEQGCVITEYPPGIGAQPYHFPARNRIVAALSPVVVIVEAGEKSGTLSTAQHAHECGRTICVVPADITREQSGGVLRLLKEGATPVTCAEDILAEYQLELPLPCSEPLRPALTGSPSFLYDCISHGAHTVETLLAMTHWDISRLYSTLSILEIDGYIVCNQQEWLKIS